MATIKVRIPAVISSDGKWAAYGYPSAQKDPDWPMIEEVADNGDFQGADYQRVWITVELPVPGQIELAAEQVEVAR